MRQDFQLQSKPFSINAATYSDARTKTREYYDWSSKIFHQLNTPENLDKMTQIRESFDENLHAFEVEITAVYPRSIFITKEGKLSARTIDVTNFEKLLVDLFFDKQFNTKPAPYGVKNINVNDKNIISLISKKSFHDSEASLLQVSVTVVPRPF